ncbi:helix-turn-helix transcriptional regulator [Agromyces sp. PvR057]|uniref:PadR family transcriptional regulator n=1 Tax=Agromyces sp. PvR057 TaxID=3156403 RepID=UPI0033910E6A
MAVRDALLALLTTGPAYGFALHGGLTERTGGRRTVNVGQTYATIERLTKQRLLEPAGTTDDGLPLHRLTDAGRLAAQAWLSGTDAAGADPWDETVDRVLIAASLPGVDAASVVEGEERRWRERRDLVRGQAQDAGAFAAGGTGATGGSGAADGSARGGDAGTAPGSAAMAGLARLAASADLARADAALSWLALAGPLTIGAALAFEPSATRPRRGRRPGSVASPPAEPALEAVDQAPADA